MIGFTDNYVRVIAQEAGLWQFHATRTAMALGLAGAGGGADGPAAAAGGLRAVLARSAIHGTAMLIYFGALAFLPVAQVAAGLFTAPIFVLLISRFAYGHADRPGADSGGGDRLCRGGPGAGARGAVGAPSLAALLPVMAGALYAMGNIATREWCAEESAETLLAGFFWRWACSG